MTTTAKIEELQKSVINAINNSCLHPAVVRLVLLNVISMVEASEREVNKKEKETESYLRIRTTFQITVQVALKKPLTLNYSGSVAFR